MKKRLLSLLLAAVTVLALCTSALAASARRWRVYVELGSIHIQGLKAADAKAKAPVWQPSWLPEGWTLNTGFLLEGVTPTADWHYDGADGETLDFYCHAPSDFSFCHWMDLEASDKTPKKTLKIQGHSANFWRVNQTAALAWEDGQGNLFLLLHSGSLTQAELEKIAGSASELTEAMPEYQLGWTPDRAALRRSMTMPGYVRDSGSSPGYVEFVCARQPLSAPKGTPEAVTVQGVPARLWRGDQTAEGTVLASAVTGKVVELPNEDTWSTILWTDPETGLHFSLQGHKLPKEVMLRMAQSVFLKKSAD